MNIVENDNRKATSSQFIEKLSNRNSAYGEINNIVHNKSTENHSTLKNSSFNSSADIEHHRIESRLQTKNLEKPTTHPNTVHGSDQKLEHINESRQSIIQKTREGFANLKT